MMCSLHFPELTLTLLSFAILESPHVFHLPALLRPSLSRPWICWTQFISNFRLIRHPVNFFFCTFPAVHIPATTIWTNRLDEKRPLAWGNE